LRASSSARRRSSTSARWRRPTPRRGGRAGCSASSVTTRAQWSRSTRRCARACPPISLVDVIHNAFSPQAASGVDAALEARLHSLRPESFKVGFVGNLLRVKGIHELVEAARITRERGVDVEFLVVGDDAAPSRGLKARVVKALGLAQNVRAEVEAALDRHALRDRFHLLGFSAEIGRAYRRMDVLCFPSHYDAPGRPIFEAAFFGVPSIVAVRRPRADTLVDGVTGLAFTPGDAVALADAIERLARDRGRRGSDGPGRARDGRAHLRRHHQRRRAARGLPARLRRAGMTSLADRSAWRKLVRFVAIYGPGRTLFKAASRLRLDLALPASRRVPCDVGIVGCGQFAFATIGYYLRSAARHRIAACFDVDSKARETLARAFAVPNVADSFEALLATPACAPSTSRRTMPRTRPTRSRPWRAGSTSTSRSRSR
jgi:hypothetical protein